VDYLVTTEDVFAIKSRPNDVIYLDPPYTKRQYASYYHVLETITLGDNPGVEGVAGLRPWKSRASVFCYKAKALQALVKLASSQGANRVLISYSEELGHGGYNWEYYNDDYGYFIDIRNEAKENGLIKTIKKYIQDNKYIKILIDFYYIKNSLWYKRSTFYIGYPQF
jgi:adenine-specific DNA methylase